MLNQCNFIGNVGNDPEEKSFQNGDKVVNFNLAVTQKWKKDGETKERTEWVKCVITNQNLINGVCNYIKKGSKLFVQGALETRSYDKDGSKVYIAEILLRPFGGQIELLDSKGGDKSDTHTSAGFQKPIDEIEDSIPF